MIARIPNEESYFYSMAMQELPLIEDTELRQGTIAFVCVQGQSHLAGVCTLEESIPLSDDLKSLWAGSFKQAYKIKW